MIDLFPYQEIGADFLSGRYRALLLDDPGLGKTAQSIVAADRAGIESVHTVCPASIVTQWRKNHEEIAQMDREFISRSYDSVRAHGLPGEAEAVILDEIHFLKNPTAQRTAKILGYETHAKDGLIRNARYVWGMTGTFKPKDPSDMFPAMNAIIPGSLLLSNGRTMGYWQFMKKFCEMDETKHGMVVKGGKNLDELADRLAPYMLRRTKKEVRKDWKEPECSELWLDQGDISDKVRRLESEPESLEIADALNKGGFDALAEFASKDSPGVSRYRRYCGILKIIPVVEWLLDQFTGGLEKIVIIAVHRDVIEGIHQRLKEQNIESVIYYGGMSEKEKDKAKAIFIKENGCRAFIGQIVSSGTGLDGLQHATGDMLFVEWSWIADDNYQALSRLDRIGQENPVIGRFAGLEGSLDGAIMAAAARRAKESKTLFG